MRESLFHEQVLFQSSYLNAFALKLTTSSEKAKDLTQDTIYKALANEDKFHGGSLRAWLGTIMRNIFINDLRKNKRVYQSKDVKEKDFLIESNSPSAKNLGDSSIMIREVKREIEKLHPDLKKAFLMRYEGFKYNEIAEQLDAPVGTIKSRIHLARKSLKQTLSSMYGSHHLSELAA